MSTPYKYVILVHQKSPILQVQLEYNHIIDNMIAPVSLLSSKYGVTCDESQDVYSMQNISFI